MKELGLSLLAHGPDVVSVLHPWLDQFESEHGVHVEVNTFEWEEAWPELVKAALYRHEHDVSEIGSTWVGSLVAMNALTPFSTRELNTYGGTSAFLPAVWRPELDAGPGRIWALPWLAYTRLIYYRRDLLDKAGINERSAFETHEQLEQTLNRLAGNGVTSPWCIPTRHSRDTLHNIASWVWDAGGEFASEDGKHILFNEAKARAGLRAYFDLYPYIAPSVRYKDESDSLFKQGHAAVVMSGPWLWPLDLHRPDVVPEVAANTGVAIPLGTAFIGFSYLVVWNRSRYEELAMKLVRKLTSADILAAYSPRTGPLSVRSDALDHSPLIKESNYQVMVQALKTGRTFPQIPLWGLVEEKLNAELEKIWNEILAESQPDIDAIMKRHLDPLAQRLEYTLSQR
jgi:multiple sugar transport system substrate-binding protein